MYMKYKILSVRLLSFDCVMFLCVELPLEVFSSFCWQNCMNLTFYCHHFQRDMISSWLHSITTYPNFQGQFQFQIFDSLFPEAIEMTQKYQYFTENSMSELNQWVLQYSCMSQNMRGQSEETSSFWKPESTRTF